jgi:hypothetical protein
MKEGVGCTNNSEQVYKRMKHNFTEFRSERAAGLHDGNIAKAVRLGMETIKAYFFSTHTLVSRFESNNIISCDTDKHKGGGNAWRTKAKFLLLKVGHLDAHSGEKRLGPITTHFQQNRRTPFRFFDCAYRVYVFFQAGTEGTWIPQVKLRFSRL